MALHGLPLFFVLNLFLMLVPYHAYGFWDPSPDVGLCESSVRMYGYKCHEFNVRTNSITYSLLTDGSYH